IRAFRKGDPSLVMTYTKSDSASVLDALANLTPAQLSASRSEVMLFDAQGIEYQSPEHEIVAMRSPPSPLRASWPLFVVFGVAIVVALFFIARRARRVS
ncbi:MAG: hypothetical protein JO199_04515, partial [Candidatus Eremiobacteraeota bacterium]|nr:hypothetical protein [Candidatus Eremiobacteraeota bacterium]